MKPFSFSLVQVDVLAAGFGLCSSRWTLPIIYAGSRPKFVHTIWSHGSDRVCLVHQLEVILLQSKEVHHTAGLNLIRKVFWSAKHIYIGSAFYYIYI